MEKKINMLWVPVKRDSLLANRMRNILAAIDNLKTQVGVTFPKIMQECLDWELYLNLALKKERKKK